MGYVLNKIIKVNESLGKVISQMGTHGDVLVMDGETNDLNKINMDLSTAEVIEGARESSVEDFYDELANNYFYDDAIQEAKSNSHDLSYGGSEILMDMTVREAIQKNVFLSDLNEFDYDHFFYQIIKDYRL
jgi:hypothetical protein